MTASKRVATSLLCTFFGVASWFMVGVLASAVHGNFWINHQTLDSFLVDLAYALPGWLLALPFVVYFRDVRGKRAWVILGIGTSLGPGFMIALMLRQGHGSFTWQGSSNALFLSAWIAFMTTASYVIALLLTDRKPGNEIAIDARDWLRPAPAPPPNS